MEMSYEVERSGVTEEDVDDVVHLPDLGLYLTQVLVDVDEELLAWVAAASALLLKVHHQVAQLAVLLQQLAQLVGLSATELLGHHVDLGAEVLLLRLKAVQHLLDIISAAAHGPVDLCEIVCDLLVLLGLGQQAQRFLGEFYQLIVGFCEGFLDLFDELGDCLVGLVELG